QPVSIFALGLGLLQPMDVAWCMGAVCGAGWPGAFSCRTYYYRSQKQGVQYRDLASTRICRSPKSRAGHQSFAQNGYWNSGTISGQGTAVIHSFSANQKLLNPSPIC